MQRGILYSIESSGLLFGAEVASAGVNSGSERRVSRDGDEEGFTEDFQESTIN